MSRNSFGPVHFGTSPAAGSTWMPASRSRSAATMLPTTSGALTEFMT